MKLSPRTAVPLTVALIAVLAVALWSGTRPEEAPAAATGVVPSPQTTITLRQPADPVVGKITPAADAATKGMFAPQVAWPLVPIHAVMTPDGHLQTYGAPLGVNAQGGQDYDEWNPARGFGAGAHEDSPSDMGYNSFCNSAILLADGRIMMLGGNSTMMSMLVDPTTLEQTMGPMLAKQRWYGTVLRLPDDRVLVMGGGDYYNTNAWERPDDNAGVATTPEIGTGAGAWTQLTGATSTLAFGARDNRWWYPRAYNGPDGKVFGISYDRLWRLDTSGQGAVTSLGQLPFAIGTSGSTVMYAPGRILAAGGGQYANFTAQEATNRAATIDISGSTPRVATTSSMARTRNWLNLTVLPTGRVLANGGTSRGTDGGAANSAYTTETWNPATGTWTTGAAAQRIRTYHSVSVLMPSGAVFTAGGGLPGPEDNANAEQYLPSYLFTKGSDGVTRWADRPEIRTLRGTIAPGQTLTLGMKDSRKVASASLISLASVTHAYNTDQRRIPLTVTQSGTSAAVTLPSSVNTLPPGSYQLSAVDANGVPSPAQIITIQRSGAGSVTLFDRDEAVPTGSGVSGDVTQPGVVGLERGTAVGLEASNFPGYRATHENFLGVLRTATRGSAPGRKADSSWTVRAGLADGSCVSLEAANWPGHYLRRRDDERVVLAKGDGSAAFNRGATWCPDRGLTGQFTSLRAFGTTDRYLRHGNYELSVAQADNNDVTRRDMTWLVRPALKPFQVDQAYGLAAAPNPGARVRHAGWRGYLSAVGATSSQLDKDDSAWIARAGRYEGSCVSFESRNYPGQFLLWRDGAVRLAAPGNDNASATWCPSTGLTGVGTTLRNAATRSGVLRNRGGTLTVESADGTDAFRDDATWLPRAAF